MVRVLHFLVLVPAAVLTFSACDQATPSMTIEPGLYIMDYRVTKTQLIVEGEVIAPAVDESSTSEICVTDPKHLMKAEFAQLGEALAGCDVDREQPDFYTLSLKKLCKQGDMVRSSVDTISVGEDHRSWTHIMDGEVKTDFGDVEVDIVTEVRLAGSC